MKTAQTLDSAINRRAVDGFTLIELLVVLAVLALCAALLLPALGCAHLNSRASVCVNNHARLCRAWLMYAHDNNGKLATSLDGMVVSSPPQPIWAAGWLDWGLSPDNTNTVYLTNPRYSILATYFGKDARLFKCPADQYLSTVQRARGWKERVRSISQDICAATVKTDGGPRVFGYLQVTNLSGLLTPKPAETWVSLDEHPDSINDAALFPPTGNAWVDLPANFHDGGVGAAYADGRAEIHHWQGSAAKFPVTYLARNLYYAPPNDPDVAWLRSHTPRKPGMN